MKFPESDTFTPAPKGLHLAVCCDFVDCGMVEKNFNGHVEQVHCVQYRYQSAKINPENGKPWLIFSSRMRLSSNERSSLRKLLESWRGEPFTNASIKDFEFEDMIGVMAQINVVHNEGRDGKTYANIGAIMPVPDGAKQLVVMDYVRVCERDGNGTHPEPDANVDDDSVPF